jgi:hypothetical protein
MHGAHREFDQALWKKHWEERQRYVTLCVKCKRKQKEEEKAQEQQQQQQRRKHHQQQQQRQGRQGERAGTALTTRNNRQASSVPWSENVSGGNANANRGGLANNWDPDDLDTASLAILKRWREMARGQMFRPRNNNNDRDNNNQSPSSPPLPRRFPPGAAPIDMGLGLGLGGAAVAESLSPAVYNNNDGNIDISDDEGSFQEAEDEGGAGGEVDLTTSSKRLAKMWLRNARANMQRQRGFHPS